MQSQKYFKKNIFFLSAKYLKWPQRKQNNKSEIKKEKTKNT